VYGEFLCLNVRACNAVVIFRMSAKGYGSVKLDVTKYRNTQVYNSFYAHIATEINVKIFKSFCN
jgi:hypothetical protein